MAQHRHPEYDIKINPEEYPEIKLNKVSYIRTHKQGIVYRKDIKSLICDLRDVYPNLYLDILKIRNIFNEDVTIQALKSK